MEPHQLLVLQRLLSGTARTQATQVVGSGTESGIGMWVQRRRWNLTPVRAVLGRRSERVVQQHLHYPMETTYEVTTWPRTSMPRWRMW